MFISSSGITYALGTEYGFGRVHSIGVEVVYRDMSTGHEIRDTVSGQYKPGPRMYSVERAVLVDYRRYISDGWWYDKLARLLKVDPLPYIGVFGRCGNLDLHPEKGYETDVLSHDELQYSGGILLGVVLTNVDINIGPFYKQRHTTERVMENAIPVTHSSWTGNWGLRVGVNLIGVLSRKNGHILSE